MHLVGPCGVWAVEELFEDARIRAQRGRIFYERLAKCKVMEQDVGCPCKAQSRWLPRFETALPDPARSGDIWQGSAATGALWGSNSGLIKGKTKGFGVENCKKKKKCPHSDLNRGSSHVTV